MRGLESLHQQVLQDSAKQKFLRDCHGEINTHVVRNKTKHADMMSVRVDEMERQAKRYGKNDESDEIQAAFGEVAGLKEQFVTGIFQIADHEKRVRSHAHAENRAEDVN